MRFPNRLLVLSLVIGLPGRGEVLSAQAKPAPEARQATENTPVSVRWNRLVPQIAGEAAAARRAARTAAAGDSAALRRIAQTPQPMLFSVYTLLSLAQYGAVNSARENRDVSSNVAVASASAAVLTELFKDSTVRASIARELARDIEQERSGSKQAIAGRKLGDDVARRVIAWAPSVNFVEPWNGTIPTGPGLWYSAKSVPPLGISLGKARTWLLDSTSQFRPTPPPAYGSPTFQASQEEVRRVVRDLTPEQLKIARRWNAADPWAIWNETASDVIRRNRVPEAEAARVLAVLNVAASDAIIACFEAKYKYWTIRPSQADTTLALPDSIGLPNFPSYPSGHACSAGSFDAVLGHFFPQERAEFTRIAEEQAMSRLYGGIHYRFDNDVGLSLGRAVARHAIAREKAGRLQSAWQKAAEVKAISR